MLSKGIETAVWLVTRRLEHSWPRDLVFHFHSVVLNDKMSSKLSCVFKCEAVSGKIMKFTEENLQQCREKLRIRVALNMKYNDIVFPDCVDDVNGYHSGCRKNFLAIPKKYIEKYDELQNKSTEVNANPVLVAEPSTSFASVSDSGNIEQRTESPQVTSMPVYLEQDKASGKQGSSVEEASDDEKASDDDSTNNQESSERICFFCDRNRKIHNYRALPLHSSVDEKLRNDIFATANACSDREIESKLDALGVNSKIYYHNPCKKTYLRKNVIDPVTPDTDWHKKIKFHELTYADICGFVEKNIINNGECHLLQFLTDCYNEILENFYVKEFESFDVKYTSQHLLEKLQKTFGDKIQVILIRQKKLIAPRDGCVINDESFSQIHDFELLSRAALMLRKKVLLISKKPLPKTLKVSDIIAGECEIPKDLTDFMRNLLCGIDSRRQKCSDCTRKMDSISQDIIYAIHHGRMKTSKHMTLGMTLKSITSSRKVVDLMNKFGHCCSYNVLDELETEATSSACNALNVSPEDALLAPNYCTGVAFDNFDRFVETTSGKDTLHDTVGILYQNISEIDSSTLNESRDSTNSLEYQSAAKRRRSLDPIVPELPH